MSSSSRKRGDSRVARIDDAHHETAAVPWAPSPSNDVLASIAGIASAAEPPRPTQPHGHPVKQTAPQASVNATADNVSATDGAADSGLSEANSLESVGPSSADQAARIGFDQIERHARELGQHLNNQQRSLDQRQADFNAKLARVETELRAARMQHREREIELTERETDFQLRWEILQEQATDVANAEMALNAEVQEDRLNQATNHDQIRDALERWKKRLTELDKSELQLQAQLADAAAERDRLRERQSEIDAERENLHHQTAKEKSLMQERIASQQLDIQKQTEQIERRKRSLEKMHSDVAQMYREGLELRICTEELWGQLSEKVSPAQLTAKVTEFRRRLADQYQLANRTLTDQRHEIDQLIKRLKSQHDAVGQQRERLQNWLSRRQTEIERQAARLVARERELDKHQANVQALEQHWDDQRRQYEQTIRELRRQCLQTSELPLSNTRHSNATQSAARRSQRPSLTQP